MVYFLLIFFINSWTLYILSSFAYLLNFFLLLYILMIYTKTSTDTYICVFVCIYAYKYVYVYTHTYTHTSNSTRYYYLEQSIFIQVYPQVNTFKTYPSFALLCFCFVKFCFLKNNFVISFSAVALEMTFLICYLSEHFFISPPF